jgi:hypothetical protein
MKTLQALALVMGFVCSAYADAGIMPNSGFASTVPPDETVCSPGIMPNSGCTTGNTQNGDIADEIASAALQTLLALL